MELEPEIIGLPRWWGHTAWGYNWNMGIQMNYCSSRGPQERVCPRKSHTAIKQSCASHKRRPTYSRGHSFRWKQAGEDCKVRQGRCLGYKFMGAFPLKVGQVQGWCLPGLTWVLSLWIRVDHRFSLSDSLLVQCRAGASGREDGPW